MSFLLVLYFYGSSIFAIMFFNLTAFCLYAALPRNTAAVAMALWTFLAMISCNIYNFFYTTQEVGGHGQNLFTALSINFAKHYILAWNYYDGGILDDPVRSKHMTERERFYAEPHRERLSFSKWMHYFFFVGTCLTPMNEYRDFEEFFEYKGNITKMPKYGNFRPAIKRFVESLFCMGLLSLLQAVIEPKYMLTDKFADENIAFKVVFLIASMHEMIFRLFIAFGMIEANFMATGLSYTPKKGK